MYFPTNVDDTCPLLVNAFTTIQSIAKSIGVNFKCTVKQNK